MAYQPESGTTLYRRRRRQRAAITLTFVTTLLVATLVYAASYVQGWVGGSPTPRSTVGTACFGAVPDPPVSPKAVTLNVYNTTSRTGLASSVARRLKAQGFKIAAIDNDPLGRPVQGVGEIRHGQTGAARAILAATRLPGARVVRDNRTDATVDFVLGSKFRAVSTPRKSARLVAAKPIVSC